MISKLLLGWGLMALCVVVHAAGVIAAVRWMRRRADPGQVFLRWTWLFICLAAWVILLHLGEISAWAFLYFLLRAMPNLQSAFYFSAVTYTTTGYGDVTPRHTLARAVAGGEAISGIFLFSLFIFALTKRYGSLR